MTTTVLAIIALVISLASLAISIEARYRDRHKVECIAGFATIFGGKLETYVLEVKVTNLGRRPISITELRYGDTQAEVGPDGYAIDTQVFGGPESDGGLELRENQTKIFRTGKLTRKHLLERTTHLNVVVIDSAGTTHTQSIENDAHLAASLFDEEGVVDRDA